VSLATRAGDLYYAFRFVKLLTTPFEETDAFKLGLINSKGERIKSEKINTSEKKTAYTPFIRLGLNIKRLLSKLPGGSSTLSSYAAALYLLREQYNISDKSLDKIIKHSGLDPLDLLSESSSWFLLDSGQLSPGVYRVRNEKVINETLDCVVKPKDQIRVCSNAYPVGNVYGIDIYEAVHIRTGKSVYVTVGELYK
jgi:hypothetical protein